MRNTNKFITLGNTTLIIMKNGKQAVISTEFLDLVKPYTWCVEGTGYVMSRSSGKAVKLHRLITNAQKGQFVDHIDGNPLNNTISNLRLCQKQQNEFNTKIRSDNKSGYKGVCLMRNGKYRAYINLNGIQHNLGVFATKEEAARAYNSKAKILFGEYARLNTV